MSLNPPVDVHGDGILVPLGLSLGHSSALLLLIGSFLLGLFFVVEGNKQRPNAVISLLIAAASSIALGFGFVFTFMWAGIFI